MKNIAVLTTFMDFPSSYGLVPVVINQLRMLVKHKYNPTFICQNHFNMKDRNKVPEGAKFENIIPFYHLFDYQPGTKKHPDFDKQVKSIEEALESMLTKFDVVITHDILFQTWFLVHNKAIRNIAKKHPNIRWLHWLHSGPAPRPDNIPYPHTLRFTGMNNSLFISPNNSMKPGFAYMYNVPIQQIRTVYHVFDVTKFFDMHPLSQHLIKKYKLLDSEILCTWATRIDHPQAKGLHKAIQLIAQMNKIKPAKMLFLNSWSDSPRAKATIANMRKTAEQWSLPQENLIFSSEEDVQWEKGVPQKVVRDMLLIANIFILPSQSETFSVSMVEAAACKNLCILNEDLNVLKEIGGNDAVYSGWGSEHSGTKIERHYKPNEHAFFMDEAKRLIEELKKNKVLTYQRKILRITNPDWVWKNQLEPLIEGE